jgi:amino acid transporter
MSTRRRFGTFEGVFTPTILTILGVIMYLRLGWVVGNAGFGGALVIILLAKVVTVTTGLAIASMSSNIKIGDGGSYAIISRSLGIEIGGAVGLPLYLSQSLGAAMYIVGFTEGWTAIFPEHDPLIVSSLVLALLITTSLISARVAMRLQYFIMFLIGFSLVSLFAGTREAGAPILLWGSYESAPFWAVFAIFFPAVTGIEAGAAMSGELKDPKTSLRNGILSSIAISFVVYVGIAYWLSTAVDSQTLRSNYMVMLDISRWQWAILAAILGATLSSALGAVVGGPRTLLALGQNRVVPFGKYFAKRSKNGEPQVAILFTGIIVETALVLGDLNTIAPLLTMFFLITYGTINLAVLIEKQTGITSYRPSFDVPVIVPLIGTAWCAIAMFLINPLFAAVSILVIIVVFAWQVRLGHTAPWGDVRQGFFTAVAEWAIRMGYHVPKSAKSWKPNLMIPVENPEQWKDRLALVRDIVFPRGSARIFSVRILRRTVKEQIGKWVGHYFGRKEAGTQQSEANIEAALKAVTKPMQDEGILTVHTVIEANEFLEGISICTQSLRGMPLPPNIMFLSMSDEHGKNERLEALMSIASREGMGIVVVKMHPEKGLGEKQKINLWLGTKSPNRNLSVLTALQLERNWKGYLNLVHAAEDAEKVLRARKRLRAIASVARLPLDTTVSVQVGDFFETIPAGSEADLNIFGIPEVLDLNAMRRAAELADTTCLFIRESGEESLVA